MHDEVNGFDKFRQIIFPSVQHFYSVNVELHSLNHAYLFMGLSIGLKQIVLNLDKLLFFYQYNIFI